MTRSRDTADTQDNAGGAVAPFVAGKNKTINGDFGIWQRGTTFTFTSATYTADRWLCDADASSTVSQQNFTPGTAPVAGYEGSTFLRFAKGAGGSIMVMVQRFEDVRTFANQTATISFWAKADANVTGGFFVSQNFGSGGSATLNYGYAPNWAITTNWQRFTYTLTFPSIAGSTVGTGGYLQLQFIRVIDALAHTIDIWGIQIENGSAATPFTTASGSIGGELALCQRYYWRVTAGAVYGTVAPVAYVAGTTATYASVPLPVNMRTTPTSLDSGNIAFLNFSRGSVFSLSSVILDASNNGQIVAVTATISGGTNATSGTWTGNNNAAGFLGFSAEL